MLHEAHQVILVTTPELPALRLAKLKLDALRKLDIGDRTRLVLNRTAKNSILSNDEISDAVGLEVFAEFASDYAGVTESLRSARPAQKVLESARQFVAKAGLNQPVQPRKKKFMERISLPITEYFRPSLNGSLLRS